MHREVVYWLRSVRKKHPHLFNGGRVLECGARHRGWNSRALFPLAEYIGLDAQEGQGVDVVGLIHEYVPDAPFDVVLSTSTLEHDPYWQQSLTAMADALKPGGALILTFAGPGYPEHETQDSPEPGYYENRSVEDVAAALGDAFRVLEVQQDGIDVFVLGLERRE